jgi:transposase InsO family protein
MLRQEKHFNQRMSVPELSQLLSNAGAAAYRQRNPGCNHFFELKQRFQHSGIEGLKDLPAAHKSHPRKTPEQIIETILSLSIEHPAWGCVRLSDTLKSRGITISSPTIQKLLIKNNMGSRSERLCRLEEKVLAGEIQPSSEQIILIEKSNPCFKERFNTSSRPAEILAQDSTLICHLNSTGKIYLQSVVDTYNGFAFGFLHPGKLPDCAVAVLHNDVLPFYRQHNIQVKAIVTNNGRQYCGTAKHHYELYLMLNEIEHQKTELHNARANGFVERFNLIALDEFFKPALQNKAYGAIESLQSDFDQWLLDYNYNRPHKGYPHAGTTPAALYKSYFERHQ